MELSLTSSHVRAARAVLNWSVSTLAHESQVSVKTIQRIELATTEARMSTTLRRLYDCFTKNGIVFRPVDKRTKNLVMHWTPQTNPGAALFSDEYLELPDSDDSHYHYLDEPEEEPQKYRARSRNKTEARV